MEQNNNPFFLRIDKICEYGDDSLYLECDSYGQINSCNKIAICRKNRSTLKVKLESLRLICEKKFNCYRYGLVISEIPKNEEISPGDLVTDQAEFKMIIEGVFEIKGRCGACISGKVVSGIAFEGDDVIIHAQSGQKKSKINRFEVFGHLEYATKGDNVGILFDNINIDDVKSGDIITKA